MVESSWLPEPLHPAIVHIPLGLVVLLPIWVALTLAAVRRNWMSSRAWLGVILLHACLFGSTLLAKETGEDEETRVARVVAAEFIEEHEEHAELFSNLALVGLGISLCGLLRGRVGLVAGIATLLFSFVLIWAAVRTGLAGSALVYEHGAAAAYRTPAPMQGNPEDASSAPKQR